MLYWEHLHNPRAHESGKVLICGHTSQKSGEIANYGHTLCIDNLGVWREVADVPGCRVGRVLAGESRGRGAA